MTLWVTNSAIKPYNRAQICLKNSRVTNNMVKELKNGLLTFLGNLFHKVIILFKSNLIAVAPRAVPSLFRDKVDIIAGTNSPARAETALVLAGTKVDFSYRYDTLTIYSKSRNRYYLFFIESCLNKVTAIKGLHCDRYIEKGDDDHALYHQDQIRAGIAHYHLKFQHKLSKAQFKQVMNVFAKSGLISPQQKDTYFLVFKQRNQLIRAALMAQLLGEKYKDERTILNFFNHCRNNDLLVHLHDFLLHPKFSYLRVQDAEDTHPKQGKEWQGVMTLSGTVDKTSRTWATLEKALSLQMIKNLKHQTSRFTLAFAAERAQQLAESHVFFGIKRSRYSGGVHATPINKTLTAFATADEATLEYKYNKLFG